MTTTIKVLELMDELQKTHSYTDSWIQLRRLLEQQRAVEEAAQQGAVKARVVCRNGHERVVEGKDFEDDCPKCGADIAEYDSRFGGE